MREQVLKTGVLMCFLTTPALVWGQSPAAGAPVGKIGVLNIQQAIFNTAEGKQAVAELQKKFQPRQQDLQRQQQEIQNLQDQIQRQQTTLSDAERIRLSRELAEKQKLFERAQEDGQSEIQEERQDVTNRIGQKMVQIIDDYAKQNGYSLILDQQLPVLGANQMADAQMQIWYAANDVRITDDIVKRYDAAFPVASTGASAPATPSGGAPRTGSNPKPASKPVDKPKP